MRNQVDQWSSELEFLTDFAKSQPRAAYSALMKGLSFNWSYVTRTTPFISHLLQPMEDVIREKLVPTLTDGPPPNNVEHHPFSLPARLGGLAIPNPCDTSDGTYDASEKISNPLKQAILTHEFHYTYDHASSQMSAKAEIQSLRRQQATQAMDKLKNDLPEVLKRSIELASERGASSWLTTIPIAGFGFKLHKGAFRDEFALRYSWSLS